MSRRGLLGGAVVGTAGYVLGRGLRQPPPIAQGSDVGVIYHEWSKPGAFMDNDINGMLGLDGSE